MYAHSFYQAARVLRARTFRRRTYPDYEALPILMLYRHALELYMKAVVLAGAAYLGFVRARQISTKYVLKTHDLLRLADDLSNVYDAVGWSLTFTGRGPRSRRAFQALLSQLVTIESESAGFRYPINRQGSGAFTPGAVVQVLDLTRRFDPVLISLDGAVTGLEDLLRRAINKSQVIARSSGSPAT